VNASTIGGLCHCYLPAGVDAHPEHGRTADDLMRAADEALKLTHETDGKRARFLKQRH